MALTKLKVALPLGTALTATAVTAYLIIRTTNDLEKNKQADEALENLELSTKPFEEEIIKAEETPDNQETDSEEKNEPSEDKGEPEEKKKSQEEPKDPKQALLDAEKDIKSLINAGGAADKLEIKIPAVAQIGQDSQKTTIEHKPSSEGDQPQSIPAAEKSGKEDGGDNLEPPANSPKEKVSAVSQDTPKSPMGKPESEEDSEAVEEQRLEATQGLKQESASRDEQPLDGASDIDNIQEKLESGAVTSENEEDMPESKQHEGQESELNSGNRGQNNGTDEEGGSQMSEDQINELIDLQGKMAGFSDRLSDLLQINKA